MSPDVKNSEVEVNLNGIANKGHMSLLDSEQEILDSPDVVNIEESFFLKLNTKNGHFSDKIAIPKEFIDGLLEKYPHKESLIVKGKLPENG